MANYSERKTERRNTVQGNFSLTLLYLLVIGWIKERPAVGANNQDLPLASKLLTGEVSEVKEEVDRPAEQMSRIDHFLETIDSFWVALGIIFHFGLPIEEMEIDAKLAMPDGGNSNVFDRLHEVAGNLEQARLQADLTYFLSLLMSQLGEHDFSPNYDIFSFLVLIKNSGNYEKEFLSGFNHQTGGELDRDELEIRYQHVRVLLKKIRSALIASGQTDVKRLGMMPQDWLPYQDILHSVSGENFQQKTKNLEELIEKRIIDPRVVASRVEERKISLVDHRGRPLL